MSNVLWVLITVAVIGYVLARRLAAEPLEARRLALTLLAEAPVVGARALNAGMPFAPRRGRRTRPLPDGRL